jgi:hypothetical protein
MAAPLIAAAATMAAKHFAKKAAKARRKSGVKKDYKENAEDSTTKEISGELRFREPRRYADDDYDRTPRMSDDYKKGGKVPKGMHRMPDGKMMKDSAHKKPVKKMGGGTVKYRHGGSVDGCAIRGKTKGRMI